MNFCVRAAEIQTTGYSKGFNFTHEDTLSLDVLYCVLCTLSIEHRSDTCKNKLSVFMKIRLFSSSVHLHGVSKLRNYLDDSKVLCHPLSFYMFRNFVQEPFLKNKTKVENTIFTINDQVERRNCIEILRQIN